MRYRTLGRGIPASGAAPMQSRAFRIGGLAEASAAAVAKAADNDRRGRLACEALEEGTELRGILSAMLVCDTIDLQVFEAWMPLAGHRSKPLMWDDTEKASLQSYLKIFEREVVELAKTHPHASLIHKLISICHEYIVANHQTLLKGL
jgi:hypothetical protein